MLSEKANNPDVQIILLTEHLSNHDNASYNKEEVKDLNRYVASFRKLNQGNIYEVINSSLDFLTYASLSTTEKDILLLLGLNYNGYIEAGIEKFERLTVMTIQRNLDGEANQKLPYANETRNIPTYKAFTEYFLTKAGSLFSH